MKRYQIRVWQEYTGVVTVEAESYDEACDKAQDAFEATPDTLNEINFENEHPPILVQKEG